MTNCLPQRLKSAFLLSLGGLIISQFEQVTLAQITPDQTLGSENSVVNQINENLQQIEGGAIRGANLFHSFSDFNIPDGAAAYFANPQNIVNIFSRVTGQNPSDLMGTLGVLGNANLFFLNPNGIVFGPNFQLDLAGSFLATTANSFTFADGEYSATNPQAPPLLTVNTNAPVGIRLEGSEGIITNQAELRVAVSKNITLAGSQVVNQGSLTAPNGTINLLGNEIELTNNSLIDISGNIGAGKVNIEAENGLVTIAPTAEIKANALASGDGGNVEISASEIDFQGTISAVGENPGEVNLTADVINNQGTIILESSNSESETVVESESAKITDNEGKGESSEQQEIDNNNVNNENNTEDAENSNVNSLAVASNDPTTENNITASNDIRLQPDTTLGNENTEIESIDENNDRVIGGAERGSNLFHSFLEFNIETGRGVYFANPVGVENILARVTGENISEIRGTLGVEGIADLYLLNPHGLLFNQNASLDLNGSFLATTADAVIFDEFEYSAVTPNIPPDLVINEPTGLTLGENSGDITNQGTLTSQKNLTLEAENLNISAIIAAEEKLTLKAQDTVTIRDSQDNPFIAVSGRDLLIQGSEIDIFALNHPASGFFSGKDLTLISSNPVIGDAHYWSRGNFKVQQLDGTLGDLVSIEDPIIQTFGDVNFAGYQGTSLHIIAGGSVTIDTIIVTGTDSQGNTINPINTPTLANVNLSDGTPIVINGSQQPTVDIRAGVDPNFISNQFLTGEVFLRSDFDLSASLNYVIEPFSFPDISGSNITIGDIWINAENGRVLLTNQYQPNLNLPNGDIKILSERGLYGDGIDVRGSDNGNAGQVFIDSRNNITLDGDILASSTSGDGGNVTLIAEEKIVTENINTYTEMDNPIEIETIFEIPVGINIIEGYDGGNIRIISKEGTIDTSEGTLNTSASYENGALILGKAGDISLEAENNIITGNIDVSSNFTDGGNVSIISHNGSVNTATGSILTWVSNLTEDIELDTVLGNFAFSVPTLGSGGNITIKAADNIILGEINSSGGVGGIFELSGIDSNFREAKGGDITIDSKNGMVSLENNSIISSSYGLGPSGNITIDANEVSLTNNSSLITTTVGLGDSGKVSINANNILLKDASQILTGTIDVAEELGDDFQDPSIVLETINNLIGIVGLEINFEIPELNFETGKGGDVILNGTESIHLENQSAIATFTTGTGEAGKVDIQTPELIVNDGIITTLTFDDNNDEGIEGNSGNISINSAENPANLINISITGDTKTIPVESLLSNFVNLIQEYAPDFKFEDLPEIPMGIAAISLSPGKAGDIDISGQEIFIENGAIISASAFNTGDGGNLTINATESINIINGSALFNATLGTGKAGDVEINFLDEDQSNQNALSSSLNLEDGLIATITFDFDNNPNTQEGDAGDININNPKSIELIANSKNGFIDIETPFTDEFLESPIGIFSLSQSPGNAGNIEINTESLIAEKGASIASSTFEEGLGGNITIKAKEEVKLVGTSEQENLPSGILAQTSGSGNAQNLVIDTPRLIIKNGAIVSSATGNLTAENNLSDNTGSAGNLIIKNAELVELSGTSPTLEFRSSLLAGTASDGNGGDLMIDSKNIVVENGASILAGTLGKGDSGILQIDAESIIVRGTATDDLPSAIAGGTVGIGKGNNVTITTNILQIENGAGITAGTFNQGKGGELIVNSETIIIEGRSPQENRPSQLNASSGIESNIPLLDNFSDPTLATGDAGNIQITTDQLFLKDGGAISTETLGEGNAGTIEIQANLIELNTQGKISASTSGRGNANNIVIDTPNITISEGASIEAFTQGGGNAGNITVNAPESIILNSDTKLIVETSDAGIAGNININTPLLTIGENAQLSATATQTSTSPTAGDINLNVNQLNISGELGIFAETQSIADAGSLTIQPYQTNPNLNIQFTDDGFISARTESIGDGGSINITAPQIINIGGQGSITTETSGSGNAGSIFINTNQLNLTDGIEISASTSNLGNSGNITLDALTLTLDNATIQALTTGAGNPGSIIITNGNNNANQVSLTNSNISTEIKADGISNQPANITINTDNLSLDASTITASTSANRDAGNITIPDADTINLINNSQITALTTGSGKAGNLNLNVEQEINIDSGSLLNVETENSGNAGDIDITAQTISIGENAELSARTRELATGIAGNITLNANQLNISGRLGIFAETEGIADAGNLTINPKNDPTLNVDFTNEGQISASTLGAGNGGDITINAPETINISGNGTIKVETTAAGDAGTINLTSQTINLTEGIEITASTLGNGNAGNINLDANQHTFDNATINSFTDGTGNAGSIGISHQGNNAQRITLNNNAQISTEIQKNGDANPNNPSNITLQTDNLSLNNSRITTAIEAEDNQKGQGTAGSILVPNAENISLNQSEITASTSGIGDTGEINLNANQTIQLNNNSEISSSVEEGATGDSQEITLNTPNLTLSEKSQISASTAGNGSAGSINVPNANRIELNNSTISTEIKNTGVANQPSNITLNTQQLDLNNKAEITASTSGEGDTGLININSSEKIELNNNSEISSSVEQGATGNSQEITLNTPNLTLSEQSQISASTAGNGSAGSINVPNANRIELNNSTISTEIKNTGVANQPSNITLNTQQLDLNNKAEITASTSGEGDTGLININSSEKIELNNNSEISSSVEQGATGNSQEITLNTPNLTLSEQSQISASTAGNGSAGSINVPNANRIELNNSTISTEIKNTGVANQPSNITLNTQQLDLNNKAEITASTSGEGDTGLININSSEKIELNNNSEISSSVEQGATGNSQEITLNTPNLTLLEQSQISASTAGNGSAGSINVPDANTVDLDNSTISTAILNTGVARQPSNITLNTQQLELNNNAEITASTSGEGDTGLININSPKKIELNNNSEISSSVEEGATGNSQEITLNTPNLTLLEQSQISASTAGNGSAGSITVPNANRIELNNSTISTEIENTGVANQPSNITLNTQQLELNNNAEITASTSGEGDTGLININSAEKIELNNNSEISSSVEEGATGNSQEITLNTPNLTLSEQSQISASTAGNGSAGSITVPNANTINLDNSTISTAILNTGVARQPSNITLNTQQLNLNNNAEITASTANIGDAGTININAKESINLNNNSTLASSANEGATGDGGDINLKTEKITLNNNSRITASSQGQPQADAGSINIQTQDINLDNKSQITATTSAGVGGSITIQTLTFQADNGSQIRTTTSGNQNAGDIQVFAQESIILSGDNTGFFANTTPGSTGDGGNIFVDPPTFIIEDGAIIAVDSLGTGDGGNITLLADNLILQRGTISAQTTSGTGGNITLVVQDFLELHNNAQISTTAGNQNTEGDGGNITIFADFIFAIPSENSDITANAFTGDGGNITITTRGLFGIEPRDQLSPFSDITASSELGADGVIEINRLNTDPIEALGNLPQAPAEVKVAQGCQGVSGGSIGFFDLGKGGISITPDDLLTSETLITPWIQLNEEIQQDSLDFSLEEFSNARIFVGGIQRLCHN